MSIRIDELTANLNIHQSLPDQPALAATDLKKEWDRPANIIKDYLNQTLVPSLNKVLEDEVSRLKESLKKETISDCYPVGITIAFNNNEDHSKFCGLNWERTGEGRFLVGYKEGDTDFGKVGKTGGKRNVTIRKENIPNYNLNVNDPGHIHNVGNHKDSYDGVQGIGVGSSNGEWRIKTSSSKTGISVNSGGSGVPLDITPVFEVRAFWTRVS